MPQLKGDIMKKEKKELRDPYYMYLGNLLIFENGIGTISDVKFVVIRDKKHIFAKPKYFAFPGEIEVNVGSLVNSENNNRPTLVNAERLHDGPREIKISASKVMDVIIRNNDIHKLKQLKF